MKTESKRHVIMQTAEKLFSDRRIHEITLDEVAQRARIGKGTIYRYFADKDDLFFQVATSGFDELCDLIEQRVRQDAPFADQLLQMCELIRAFFKRRREMFRMMQAEDARMPRCKGKLSERWSEHRKKLVAAVAGILRHGMAAGVVRDDIPAEILAHFLLGMLRTRAHDLEDAPAWLQGYELVIELFCNGIARKPVQAPLDNPTRRRPFKHLSPKAGRAGTRREAVVTPARQE
jgi:AcrR family transcriptional regulator